MIFEGCKCPGRIKASVRHAGRVGFNTGKGEGSNPDPARARGGGGGGLMAQTPEQQGRVPQPSDIPAPIPNFPPALPPSLPLAGLDIDPALWKNLKFTSYGDPRSNSTVSSNGSGSGGGMGAVTVPSSENETEQIRTGENGNTAGSEAICDQTREADGLRITRITMPDGGAHSLWRTALGQRPAYSQSLRHTRVRTELLADCDLARRFACSGVVPTPYDTPLRTS